VLGKYFENLLEFSMAKIFSATLYLYPLPENYFE